MDNSFSVFGTDEAVLAFRRSSIKTCDQVLSHYDFVINDISSNISDPVLEATKGPTLEFLKKMRANWLAFQNTLRSQVEQTEPDEKEAP